MIKIWLFAVTAVVFTVALVDPTPSTKLRAGPLRAGGTDCHLREATDVQLLYRPLRIINVSTVIIRGEDLGKSYHRGALQCDWFREVKAAR
jgi:hypothetical protein